MGPPFVVLEQQIEQQRIGSPLNCRVCGSGLHLVISKGVSNSLSCAKGTSRLSITHLKSKPIIHKESKLPVMKVERRMEPHSASPQHGGLKMRGIWLESVCQGLRKGESHRKPHQSSVREDIDRGVHQCLQPIPNQASRQQ